MSFNLRTSAQRDPSAGSGEPAREGRNPGRSVATVEITGRLTAVDRQKLREQVEALGPSDVQTIVIALIDVSAESETDTREFCDWIGALRNASKPVHVAALQAEIHELLNELGRNPEWLMPLSGCETRVSRKVVNLEGPHGG